MILIPTCPASVTRVFATVLSVFFIGCVSKPDGIPQQLPDRDARIQHGYLYYFDGAGGGTGMSPWTMMNEWGIPTVYLECLLHEYLSHLQRRGEFVPDCAVAGGLSMEDHVFKALALGAPFVKLACMGRAILTATMVGNQEGKKLAEKCAREGTDLKEAYLEHFAECGSLRHRYPLSEFPRIPAGGVGLYSFIMRMTQGLQQFMAGARKFALKYVDRNDLVALTEEAAKVSGIPYIMDSDADEVEKILGYRR